MELREHVALVTGASRGIGRQIALGCAGAGARVALLARSRTALEEAAREIRTRAGEALVLAGDVTDRARVASAVEEILGRWGRIDLLVNNAGRLACISPAWEIDPEEWWAEVRVNLLGVYLCCRAVIPRMLERREGRIINLVGGGVKGPFPHASAYAAGKAAVMRLSETLAAELEGTGVRVFPLSPGFVRTEMTEQFVSSEAGRRWMGWLGERFARGEDVPGSWAADLVVAIASGRLDPLSGRYIDARRDHEGLEQLVRDAPRIRSSDSRTFRVV